MNLPNPPPTFPAITALAALLTIYLVSALAADASFNQLVQSAAAATPAQRGVPAPPAFR